MKCAQRKLASECFFWERAFVKENKGRYECGGETN